MPRRLLAVNIVLAGVSVLCMALIVRQLAAVRPAATPRARSTTAAAPPPAAASEARLPAQAYNVIASRNLFSPTRSEAPGPGVAGSAPVLVAKPALHGVVLREGSPIAYLEDPLTKRIAGYRVGDPIAGGTVQTISADAVMISRPDGMVDVRLRDPSKPRPAPAAPPQAGQPGQQPVAGQPPAGGQLPNQGLMPAPAPAQQPPRAFTPPGPPVPQPSPMPQPMMPGQAVPAPPPIQAPTPGQPNPFGRPAPSLGRRVPPIPTDPSGQPLPAPAQ
jgi:hypothetical protein